MATLTGVIWMAVSSERQTDNVSLGEQLRQGLYHAAQRGVTVAGALVVPGKSRSITLFGDAAERVDGFYLTPAAIEAGQAVGIETYIKQQPTPPGVEPVMVYAKFLELARAKQFDVFFFLNRSRLGRKASLSMSVVGVCEDYDIRPFDMESPPASLDRNRNRDERYMGAIKSVEGENQIIKIQDDHRTGMIRRAELGKMPGKINFGYLPVYDSRGKLTGYSVDEEAATTIRLIVRLYLDSGYGALNIADYLNRHSRPAPAGGEWGHTQITFLLRRMWRYAGYVELNRYTKTNRPYIRARGKWPAIISEDDVRRIETEQDIRRGARKSVHTVYRFTRMVYCAVCDARFHCHIKKQYRQNDNGTHSAYAYVCYRCPGSHTSIGEKKIIKAITAYINVLSTQPEARQQWTARPSVDQSATIMADIEALNLRIDKLNRGIAQADVDYYGKGALEQDAPRHAAIVAALKKQIAQAQAEVTTLQNRLHEEERNSQREQRLDDIVANTLRHLAMDDVRTANAWLRDRIAVTVEGRHVVKIALLF